MPKPRLVTYTNPASVKIIMTFVGSGTGILNTDAGLFLINEDHPTGKTYPKGTVFAVTKGSVREWIKNESS